jgi:hypothetical protein
VVNQSKGSAERVRNDVAPDATEQAAVLLQVALSARKVMLYPSPPSSEYVGRRKSNVHVVLPPCDTAPPHAAVSTHCCQARDRSATVAQRANSGECSTTA